MSSHEVGKYFKMFQVLTEGTDSAIEEQIVANMNHLWYFYLSPSDKKIINERLGEHRRKR